ncbi:MAG: hypothetical protein IJR91_05370 [Ruminococcus sp.]|nr:hypothetical protein [Ruminococcus sp.]
MDLKTAILVFAVSCVFAAVLTQARGLPWFVTVILCAVVGIVLFGSMLLEKRDNKKSFAEAERFRAGFAFKSEKEERKYYDWCAKHPPARPSEDMKSDLISRYRAPRIIAELLGVLCLGLLEVFLFKEKAEGHSEAAWLVYLVLGLMILLLYFALSGIFGIKARRLYGMLSDRPDFQSIRRSYTEGAVIGHPVSYICLGSEYITLVTAKGVLPVRCSEICRVCRAIVLTAYYTNSAYTGSKESYFIKLYTTAEYRIQLTKPEMIQAYDLLKRAGLPADDTIDIR